MNNLTNRTPLQELHQFGTPENIALYNRLFSWKTQPPIISETYSEIKDTFEVWYSFSGKSDDVAFPEIAMIKRGISSDVYEIEDEQIRYPEKHSDYMNPYKHNLFNKIKLVDAAWFANRYGGDFFYFRTDVLSPNATDATEIHRNKKLHLNGKYRLFVTDPRARDILFTMIMTPRNLPKHEYLSLNNSLKLFSLYKEYSVSSNLSFNHNDTISIIDYYYFGIEGLEYYLNSNSNYFDDNSATNIIQMSFNHSPNVKKVDTLIAQNIWDNIDFSTRNTTTWDASGHSTNIFEYPFKQLEHGESFTFYFKVTYANITPTLPDVITYFKISINSGKYIKVWEDQIGDAIAMQYGSNPILIKEMFDRKAEFCDNIKITYSDIANAIYKFKIPYDTIDPLAENNILSYVKYIDQFKTNGELSIGSDVHCAESQIQNTIYDSNDDLYEYTFEIDSVPEQQTPYFMLMYNYGKYNGFWHNDNEKAGPNIAYLNRAITHTPNESIGSDFELVQTLEGLELATDTVFTYNTVVPGITYTDAELNITQMT